MDKEQTTMTKMCKIELIDVNDNKLYLEVALKNVTQEGLENFKKVYKEVNVIEYKGEIR